MVGGWRAGDLRPALDVETAKIDEAMERGASGAEVLDRMLTWLKEVRGRTGMAPFLYLSERGLRHLGVDPAGLGGFPLWLAKRVSDPLTPVEPPVPWGEIALLQWSSSGDHGAEYGVSSEQIDLNIYRASSQTLRDTETFVQKWTG